MSRRRGRGVLTHINPLYGVLVGAVAIVALLVAGTVTGSGTYGASPGPVMVVNPTGDAVTDKPGAQWFVPTVVMRELSPIQSIMSNMRGEPVLSSRHSASGSESAVNSMLEMEAAKRNAVAAADAYLNGTVVIEAVVVSAVDPGSPAERGGLKTGDRLISVNGHESNNLEQFASFIENSTDVVVLGTMDGREITLRHGGGPLGMTMLATPVSDVPDITFMLARVSGGSGGLMFTLAALDAMTPGDLSGGLKLAGTGTIRSNGRVGSVVGVASKVESAGLAGMELFLAPKSPTGTPPRVGAAPMKVVEVDSLSTALEAICTAGSKVACQLIETASKNRN